MDRNPYGPFSADPAVLESLVRVIVTEVVRVLAERNMLALTPQPQPQPQAYRQTPGLSRQPVYGGAAWSPSARSGLAPRQGQVSFGAAAPAAPVLGQSAGIAAGSLSGTASGNRAPGASVPQVTEAVQEVRGLATEQTVLDAFRGGIKVLKLAPGTIVTPLARDVAREKGISLEFAARER